MDDGVGFDVGIPSTGFGLAGLRTRAAAIGGDLTVHSTPGTGTRVCLEVDIIRSND
jgi:signal transduction histidine kinase